MWTNCINGPKVVALVVATFFVWGCSENPTNVEPVKEVVAKESKTEGVLYKPSELASTMRNMYLNMKVVNNLLDSGVFIPDSLLTGYESMLTDTPTNPEEIGAKFAGFAEGWLSELETFKTEPNIDNYNSLMNACVHCHQSFCPGPIKKIKKLKLIGSL